MTLSGTFSVTKVRNIVTAGFRFSLGSILRQSCPDHIISLRQMPNRNEKLLYWLCSRCCGVTQSPKYLYFVHFKSIPAPLQSALTSNIPSIIYLFLINCLTTHCIYRLLVLRKTDITSNNWSSSPHLTSI